MVSKKILAGLLAGWLSTCAISSPKSHLIVFGDSLSDAGMNLLMEDRGNNDWAHSEGKTGAPIVNQDTLMGTHPLWVNWLVKNHFPGELLIPWRLAHLRQLDPATQSINYAFAAAETGDNYLNDISGEPFPPYVDSICNLPGKLSDNTACVPGVLKQIGIYLDAVHHPDADTVFIIWAGGNDLFNNIKKTFYLFNKKEIKSVSAWLIQSLETSDPAAKNPVARPVFPIFSDPVLNLLKAKDRLIAAGVTPKQIYIINLPDLSRSPAGIAMAQGNPAVLQAIHFLSIGFNESLSLMLAHNIMSETNLPDSHILSIYNFLNEVIEHPDKYNIINVSGDCFMDGKLPQCTGYIFYDDKHPTAETGKDIAKWVESQMQQENPPAPAP